MKVQDLTYVLGIEKIQKKWIFFQKAVHSNLLPQTSSDYSE